METRLNKTTSPHFWCLKKSTWFVCIADLWPMDSRKLLWLSATSLIPGLTLDCLVHNLAPHYDVSKDIFYNTPGVDVRPRADRFGLDGVSWVDPYLKGCTTYFGHMISFLENAGYEGLKRTSCVHMVFLQVDVTCSPFLMTGGSRLLMGITSVLSIRD